MLPESSTPMYCMECMLSPLSVTSLQSCNSLLLRVIFECRAQGGCRSSRVSEKSVESLVCQIVLSLPELRRRLALRGKPLGVHLHGDISSTGSCLGHSSQPSVLTQAGYPHAKLYACYDVPRLQLSTLHRNAWKPRCPDLTTTCIVRAPK